MIYVIYDMNEIDQVDFSQVIEDSINTLRLSMDGTKTILKFLGETPSFLDGLVQYNHQQIIQITKDPINGWMNIN